MTAVAIVGSAYNGTTQAADDPSKELGCGDTYTEALAIGRIANNAWNRQAAGDYPSRQCIRLRSTPNGQQYGWSWDWPTQSDTLLSFPQVIFGWKPWDGGKSSHPQLPMRIAEVGRLELSYEIETRASGKHNLATTLWLTRTGSIGAEPNPKDINTDLMIWTDGFDFDPFGTQVGRASIDGLDFEVWFASELSTPDADGPRWSYVAYRATAKRSAASLDLKAFLIDAIERGYVSPDHYVSDVEVGNEIMSGAGETWIKTISLVVR